MTLQQWAKGWPYRVIAFRPTNAETGAHTGPETGAMVTPDTVHPSRAEAWHLTDYRVSSVSGGSIWFVRRTNHHA